jgi:hypothetical protein
MFVGEPNIMLKTKIKKLITIKNITRQTRKKYLSKEESIG